MTASPMAILQPHAGLRERGQVHPLQPRGPGVLGQQVVLGQRVVQDEALRVAARTENHRKGRLKAPARQSKAP